MRKFWPLSMIICFGFLDMASTMVVYLHLGTFEYESGVLLLLLFQVGGIPAVIVEKIALTTISAALLYYLAKYRTKFDLMCTLMCAGTTIVGLLASASNLIGALTLTTLSVLGTSVDLIGYTILFLAFAAGLVSVILNYSGVVVKA